MNNHLVNSGVCRIRIDDARGIIARVKFGLQEALSLRGQITYSLGSIVWGTHADARIGRGVRSEEGARARSLSMRRWLRPERVWKVYCIAAIRPDLVVMRTLHRDSKPIAVWGRKGIRVAILHESGHKQTSHPAAIESAPPSRVWIQLL